jgi:tight adherence protein B
MGFIFGNDFIFIPLFGLTVFLLAYMTSDRAIAFLHRRSLGTREEILELMDRMFIETDKKRITIIMLLCSFGLGAVVFLITWPHIIVGGLLGAMVTIIGWSLPKIVMKSAWERRCSALTNQMVDGMTIMGNSIKAGQSLNQAMERVVENMKGPLPQEFGLVLNKIRLGMATEEALNEFADRIPRQDVQMFVTSVNILKETGGNLAETFATIVTTVRERQKVEKKIQALTAQGTMQAIIITFVPFLIMGVLLAVDPNFIMPLFTRPLGWVALFLIVVLQVLGLVIMKKIVTIKV